jgi:hypothetical protein
MKSVLTIMGVLCLWFSSAAQSPEENRTDLSPYGKTYTTLNAEMKQLAPHELATQISYFDMNFVNVKMQQFMDEQMAMANVGGPVLNKKGMPESFSMKYIPKASIGATKIPSITIKYNLFTNSKGHPIIKSCEIYGDLSYIAYFYAKYWPTNMNFDSHGPAVVYCYLLQDKAGITLNRKTKQAVISINNTTIKSVADYDAKLNKNVASQ